MQCSSTWAKQKYSNDILSFAATVPLGYVVNVMLHSDRQRLVGHSLYLITSQCNGFLVLKKRSKSYLI